MTAMQEMPKYRSHKEVWALKIANVIGPAEWGADWSLEVEDEGFAPLRVSAQYVQKHGPKVGGYFVQYQDGYQSFSPADAFEGGYTRIEG